MGWTAPLVVGFCGVIALCLLISPNGVRRGTGRLVPAYLRGPDFTPRQVIWWRIGMAVLLAAVIAWFVFYL